MKDKILADKVALVTGSRRGIGRATAIELARAGANVAVCDLIATDSTLELVEEEIRTMGVQSKKICVDISQKRQVESMVRKTLETFGKIDILVNCAGVWLPGETMVECTESNWDKVIDTNLKGTFLCCQAAGKVMVSKKSGIIINLSSQVGINPGTGIGAYSISKAGIIMLTRQLALELSGFNIRVNAIAPGVVKTDFNRNIWEDAKNAEMLVNSIPLGRLAEPEDIAQLVLFLASDSAGYITGAIFNIDGGWQVPASRPKSSHPNRK